LAELAGASLRRAPYAWLATTALLYLTSATSASAIAKKPRDASAPIAIGAAAIIAYGIVASVVLVPRFVIPRLRSRKSDNQAALMRWAFSVSPFAVGYAAVGLGGQPWEFALGAVASLALTIHAARSINREARTG
jgi:hypothetical protein